MNPNPIRKVLSTLQTRNVQCLLMGGQACVLYGAAEFSRDTDLALLAEADNLDRLRQALRDLCAENIAVPPLDMRYLARGHAVHFRCAHPDALDMRVDVMSVLRGLPAFPALWARRTTVAVGPGEQYELLSLPDLVAAKKTQRDKDWPMIRRLIEADYIAAGDMPGEEQVRFWLCEARTPALLMDLARRYPAPWRSLWNRRELLRHLLEEDDEGIARRLRDEEDAERTADRAYWLPLRRELEDLRHGRG